MHTGSQKWKIGSRRFVTLFLTKLSRRLHQTSTLLLLKSFPAIASAIDSTVLEAMLNQPPFQTFSDGMKPAEFETFCAEELRRAGWDARVTMQSRDQGVDVVAEKNGVRVQALCSTRRQQVSSRSRCG